ncbi:MAG: 4Fe-4S binding protein [Saprospiraceae bacterium]|uniref:4Fe-4S binding protein n=1 Tax=Candidatus Opimibacter skivensis TaxID=2982028 RepID=A0A9D7SU09_9BACT|nr:4Fe-4S binding protein [Candidatus Opimibacter skivensis]
MGKSEAVLFSISWNACIQCGVCIAICPQELPFVSDFDTIAVHTPCAIACMICETICPVSAITSVLRSA